MVVRIGVRGSEEEEGKEPSLPFIDVLRELARRARGRERNELVDAWRWCGVRVGASSWWLVVI
jgi:hypothetical protein